MELECKVMNYDWGKPGLTSLVAEFASKNSFDLQFIEPHLPYAEFWIGTHPSAPATIKGKRKPLAQFIASNIKSSFENLPYLMKILSIQKALSIQIHPDKEHAKELFNTRRDLVTDDNHKPELVYALTDFEMLCGFRPIREIVHFLDNVPELMPLTGLTTIEHDSDEKLIPQMKTCFRALVSAKKDHIENALQSLFNRFETQSETEQEKYLIPLIKRLYADFPNDIGCLLVYFLNYMKLFEGQVVYVPPREIHCYLSGECIECQACSDNIIRAGLTPKRKNVDLLCDLANFLFEEPSRKLMSPIIENDFTHIYRPPIPDFAIAKILIKKEQHASVQLITRKSTSFLMVLDGRGEFFQRKLKIKRGTVLFLEENEDLGELHVIMDLIMFQAMENIS